MNEKEKSKYEINRKLDIIKNKKLVTILNHKMFKGYRDIKASKWFFNQKPKYISALTWENKIFDPFDELYNLNYKTNVLYPLKTPNFDNILFIKNYPSNLYSTESRATTIKNDQKRNRPKTSFNSFSTNYKNRTIESKNDKKKDNLYDQKNNFYLTSMSVYQTDNFYREPNPEKVYKEVFKNEKVIYNDIPIISLDKVTGINKIKKAKAKNKIRSKNKNKKYKPQIKKPKNEIIESDNIHDDYNGLTEKQFLYKISHNKSNKNINEKIYFNTFRKNKGFVKGFVSRRLKSAKPMVNLGLPTLNKRNVGPKGVTIELEFDEIGNMKTKKMYTIDDKNSKEEIIDGTKNNFLIYNTKSIETNRSKSQSKTKFSTYKENEYEDPIFGNPFKNINNNQKEPQLKEFQNKPRIFDDKILLQFQLDKRNEFFKLKQKIMK
jgi:hypothetical protein